MAGTELSRYGWDAEWAASAEKISADGAAGDPGRVVRHHGVAVDVATAEGETISLSLRRGLKEKPLVGDWVLYCDSTLVDVLPRRTLLERRSIRRDSRHPLVANVDQVLITCGLDRPLNPGRIRRSTTLARQAGTEPRVVLTKADLGDRRRQAEAVETVTADHPGLDVLVTSAVTGLGLPALSEAIGTTTVALLGESGSGKSSLVNALVREQVARTGSVRDRDRKGRHTTTARELYPLPEAGIVVDTPGLRSIGLWADTDAVEASFDDITELAESCRFRDCAHDREPGCAVRAAVEDDTLSAERLKAFRELEQEAAESRPSHHRRRR